MNIIYTWTPSHGWHSPISNKTIKDWAATPGAQIWHKYEFWDNAKGWHTQLLCVCTAKSITDASVQCHAKTGIHPAKSPHISVTFEVVVETLEPESQS